MTRRFFATMAAIIGLTAAGSATAAIAAPSHDPVPHCQRVVVFNAGHNYHGVACNDRGGNWIKTPPVGQKWQLAFSGGLANGFSLFAAPMPKDAKVGSKVYYHTGPMKPAPAGSLARARQLGLSTSPGCWNYNGVQMSGLIGYECISQPSNLGGALYWSANEADINGDKHPGSGLLWVESSTLHPTSDSNPPNPYQDFWVGIAHEGGTFCTVINPGYDQKPTLCEFTTLLTAANQASCSAVVDPGSGQPKVCVTVKIMSPRRQASYDQYANSVKATSRYPDCGWSMVVQPDQAQCDIDS